jgi:outer membrane scaffolding protein for murein synthesis (MipA/OmpV family)
MYAPLLASAIFLTALGAAHAQEAALAPEPSQKVSPDLAPVARPALPLWEVGAFGGGLSTPAYPGSVDRTARALLVPFFIYRGEVFRADRSGIGARVVHQRNYEFDIGFSVALPANSDVVQARSGMPDLGTLLEFGPRAKFTLARPAPGSELVLELPLRMVLELRGGVRDRGVAFEPALTYDIRDIGAGWSLGTSAGLMLGDQRLNQHFYGVEPAYATATRPQYDAQAGLISTRFSLNTSKAFNKDVRFGGYVRYESYQGAANLNSPLHLASQGTSVGVGITWTLGRSDSKAAD